MKLVSEERWEQGLASCGSMHELSVLMRRCCKAREETDEAMEDDEKSGNRVICYDKGRRSLPLHERYHRRRLLLFAEPQIGKTGAFLGLIEVARATELLTTCYACAEVEMCLRLRLQVLRKRLASKPIEIDDPGDVTDEGGDIDGKPKADSAFLPPVWLMHMYMFKAHVVSMRTARSVVWQATGILITRRCSA
jgi:hypothetical protein